MTTVRDRFLKLATFAVTEDITSFDKGFYDMGSDSLDIVELVMGAEEEFKIEIPDDDVYVDTHSMRERSPLKLSTINDWVTYIEGKLNG